MFQSMVFSMGSMWPVLCERPQRVKVGALSGLEERGLTYCQEKLDEKVANYTLLHSVWELTVLAEEQSDFIGPSRARRWRSLVC